MTLWVLLRRWAPWRACCAVVVAAAFVGSYGCSEGGTGHYHVSGTVTHDGQAVPSGIIMFEPDTSQGNSGPAGTAGIFDGKFDTQVQGGQPPAAGPHIVRIRGMEGPALDEDGLPAARPIFPEYRTAVDLPTEPSNWDFEVPVQ